MFRTLPLLFLGPGELTRRYVAGERARFVSPLALFLFSVFLMFATIGAFGSADFGKGFDSKLDGAETTVIKGRAEARATVERIERRRAVALAAGQRVAAIDKRLAEARGDLAMLSAVQSSLRVDGTKATIGLGGGPGWITEALGKVSRNPGLFLYKLQSSAYKYS